MLFEKCLKANEDIEIENNPELCVIILDETELVPIVDNAIHIIEEENSGVTKEDEKKDSEIDTISEHNY